MYLSDGLLVTWRDWVMHTAHGLVVNSLSFVEVRHCVWALFGENEFVVGCLMVWYGLVRFGEFGNPRLTELDREDLKYVME